MYIMEYKYTDTVTLSLDIEVGMFPLFVLTCLVISLCNVRYRISGLIGVVQNSVRTSRVKENKFFRTQLFFLTAVFSHGCLTVEKSACLLTVDIGRGSLGNFLIAKAQPNQISVILN